MSNKSFSRQAIILPAVLLLFACQHQELNFVSDNEIPGSGDIPRREVTITADLVDDTPDTRTSSELVEGNKTRVYWSPGDQIRIFSKAASSVFTSQNTTPSRTAQFKGDISMVFGDDGEGDNKEYVWGLYPNREDAEYEEVGGVSANALITTTLPSLQQGKEDSFADGTFITIGRSEESLRIPFKGVCTGVYVTFKEDTDIFSVTLRGLDNEPLAGKFKVGMDESGTPVINSVIEPEYSVTVLAPDGGTFKKDKLYYIITLPVKFTRGFSLTARKTTGLEGTCTITPANAPEFKMNAIGSVKLLDNRISTWAQSGEQGLNEIWFTVTTGDEIADTDFLLPIYNQYTPDASLAESLSYDSDKGVWVLRLGSPVTEIPKFSFQEVAVLKSISLPESVNTIGLRAFYRCSNLESVITGNSIEDIRTQAFLECSNLKDVVSRQVLGSGNRDVPHGAVLPEGLKRLGIQSFENCRSIESVTLPESLESIGSLSEAWHNDDTGLDFPFRGCSNLMSFFGKFASDDHKSLVVDDVLGRKVLLGVACGGSDMSSFIVPNGIQVIGGSAFAGTKFSHIYLPVGLELIEDWAFCGCDNLLEVEIPSTVTAMSVFHTFDGCRSLRSITIKNTDDIMEAYWGTRTPSTSMTFFGWDANDSDYPIYVPAGLLRYYQNYRYWEKYADRYENAQEDNEIWYTTTDGSVAVYDLSYDGETGNDVISNTNTNGKGVIKFAAPITEIDAGAFLGDRKLLSVTLPDCVETIKPGAFSTCGLLSEITMNGVKHIGTAAFESCGFEELILPEGLEALDSYAFTYNHNLQRVVLPQSLTLIGYVESADPTSLLEAYINPFKHCEKLRKFEGKFASEDGRYLSFAIGEDVALISFADYGLTSYTVPGNITVILGSAFCGCNSLERVILSEGLVGICNDAFGCEKLSYVSVPSSVSWMGMRVFNDSHNLKVVRMNPQFPPTILLPSSFPSTAHVSNIIFYKLDDLVVYVPSSSLEYYSQLDYWGDYYIYYEIFQSDREIWYTPNDEGFSVDHSVDFSKIQEGVEGRYCFAGCYVALFDNPVTSIPDNAFKNADGTYNTALKSITLPGSVQSIGICAFQGCSNLEYVKLADPDALTTIGSSAFSTCQKLKVVGGNVEPVNGEYITELPAVTSLGGSAFYQDKEMHYLSLPALETLNSSVIRFAGITTLDIPNVKTLGSNSIYDGRGLTVLHLPSVEVMNATCLGDCRKLEEIHIGPNVGSMTACLFEQDPLFTYPFTSTSGHVQELKIYMEATTPPAVSSETFKLMNDANHGGPVQLQKIYAVYVPAASEAAYEAAWADALAIALPDGMTAADVIQPMP